MPDIREESPAGVRRSRSIGSHRSEPVQLRGCLTLLELTFLDEDSIKLVRGHEVIQLRDLWVDAIGIPLGDS